MGSNFIFGGFTDSSSLLSSLLYPTMSPFDREGDDGFGSSDTTFFNFGVIVGGCMTLVGEYIIVGGGVVGGTIEYPL